MQKAQLNPKSAEMQAAAFASFFRGAISMPSNTRRPGLIPVLQFPLKAKIASNKALLRILMCLSRVCQSRVVLKSGRSPDTGVSTRWGKRAERAEAVVEAQRVDPGRRCF